MANTDITLLVPLHIMNPFSETTIIQVDVTHLNKRIEVSVPNNIQVGHRIRLKGLGYHQIPSSDLIIEISKITIEGMQTITSEGKNIMQKMLVVKNNDFDEVNNLLKSGWKVIEFKPFKNDIYPYVYVLLEKEN